MRKSKQSDAVLGVYVTPRSVIGILLRPVEQYVEVVGQFVKHRSKSGDLAGGATGSLPGLRGTDDTDYHFQSGGDGSGSDSFSGMGDAGGGLETGLQETETLTTSVPTASPPFGPQLKLILSECQQLGYPNPRMAFCLAPPDVSYVELRVPADAAKTEGKSKTKGGKTTVTFTLPGPLRKSLIKLLTEQHTLPFENGRVEFLPMQNVGRDARFLALAPIMREPVVNTLDDMLQDHTVSMGPAVLSDSELSVYSALIRRSILTQEAQLTALIRVGTEDTLILFFEGKTLMHQERLRSITTYDVPEKVCSRVLLQQDEQKVGELDRVFLLTEGRIEQLLESFRNFYPKAEVQPMQQVLKEHGITLPAEEDALKASVMSAMGVGLRLVEDWDQDNDGTLINLMPKKIRHRKPAKLLFSWHTWVMLLMLFGTTFYFVTTYLQNESEIRDRRQELELNPMPALEDPALLKARVDSLQQTYQQYTTSLKILDSLMLGSDRWSRFLQSATRATGERSGLWLSRWEPESRSQVRLEGTSLSRSRVVQFARTLNGSIERLTSDDIVDEDKDVRVYHFTVSAPVPVEIPQVALHLQEQARLKEEASEAAKAKAPAQGTASQTNR